MKTLDTNVLNNWKIEICQICLDDSLPFQSLDDFDYKLNIINNENLSEKDMDRLNQLKYNPFEKSNNATLLANQFKEFTTKLSKKIDVHGQYCI